jgi:hypothetical protein
MCPDGGLKFFLCGRAQERWIEGGFFEQCFLAGDLGKSGRFERADRDARFFGELFRIDRLVCFNQRADKLAGRIMLGGDGASLTLLGLCAALGAAFVGAPTFGFALFLSFYLSKNSLRSRLIVFVLTPSCAAITSIAKPCL